MTKPFPFCFPWMKRSASAAARTYHAVAVRGSSGPAASFTVAATTRAQLARDSGDVTATVDDSTCTTSASLSLYSCALEPAGAKAATAQPSTARRRRRSSSIVFERSAGPSPALGLAMTKEREGKQAPGVPRAPAFGICFTSVERRGASDAKYFSTTGCVRRFIRCASSSSRTHAVSTPLQPLDSNTAWETRKTKRTAFTSKSSPSSRSLSASASLRLARSTLLEEAKSSAPTEGSWSWR
mmetsp:Transcript_9415/g.38541  ORF Transcript_9415/g.38541 Transcript_9415/m.38541 type:complete len:240 (-) Transcript_9415:359-1078(-)